MILAIGVAAIVLITVNTVLFAALRLHEATAETVDAASPVDAAVTFLRRDLQCVVTPTNGTSKVLSGDFRVGEISSTGVAAGTSDAGVQLFTSSNCETEVIPAPM